MTRHEVDALFERYEQAMCRHDIAMFTGIHAADAVVDSPTAGGTVSGRDAIEAITRAWFTGFPDVEFTTQDIIVDGDRVVWILTTHGTDTGGFLGLPPTGKPFRVPMVVICTMGDAQIRHERRIYDFTGLLTQIGVLKVKPA